MVLKILGTSCWYRENCITKLWAESSYFLYLYMVFCQHCFHLEQHWSPVLRTFQTDWVYSNIQYSLVIQNSCSMDYPFILSHVIPIYTFSLKFSNISVCPVVCTQLLGIYFNAYNAIDNHNWMWQSYLALDKYWVKKVAILDLKIQWHWVQK